MDRLNIFHALTLTVQLCLMQSSQKRLAENFFFTTTVSPWIRHWPIPMILPGKKRRQEETANTTGYAKSKMEKYTHQKLEACITYLLSDREAGSHRWCHQDACERQNTQKQQFCSNYCGNTGEIVYYQLCSNCNKSGKRFFILSNVPTVHHNGSLGQSCGARGVNVK